MKTLVTRPSWLPLLACFFCGSTLLTVGLYRWPPVRAPYSSSTRDPHAGSDKPGDLLQGISIYLLAALLFAGGLVLWRRGASKGYRLGDLWGRRWAGGKALWLILNLHFVGAAYALLVFVGRVASLLHQSSSSAAGS
ncbi:MAG TPA: hypothetical protein VM222_06185 [Planctomycetota bacterium]|nr:hypothetical protein [Planctomycetota bacterium]